MPSKHQSRRFSFTINNYTEDDLISCRGAVASGDAVYLLFGLERGEQGTPHIQGYVETPRKITICGLRKCLFGTRAHFEVARGTALQNATYCSKEGPIEEFGTAIRGGHRGDLDDCKAMLDERATIEEVASLHFSAFLQYRKGMEAYKQFTVCDRDWKTRVSILWGNPGTGKTTYCRDLARLCEYRLWTYNASLGGIWFDGYCGQEAVLFDDYVGGIPFEYFIKLLDQFPMEVPVKGGFVKWSPRRIFITSNVPPSCWYRSISARRYKALVRRTEECYAIDEPLYQVENGISLDYSMGNEWFDF